MSVTIGVFHVCFALICANKLCLVEPCLAHMCLVLVHVIGFESIVFVLNFFELCLLRSSSHGLTHEFTLRMVSHGNELDLAESH